MDLTDEWGEDAAGGRSVPESGYGPPHGPWAPFDRPQSAPPASGPPAPADRGGFMPTGRRGFGSRPGRRPAGDAPYADAPYADDPYGDDPYRDDPRGDNWTGRLQTGPPLRRGQMPDDLDGPPPGRGRPTSPGRDGPPPGRGRPSGRGPAGRGPAGRGASAGRPAGRDAFERDASERDPSGRGGPSGGRGPAGGRGPGGRAGDSAPPERPGGSAKLLLGALVLGLVGVAIVLGIKAVTASSSSGGSAGTTTVTPAGKALYNRIALPTAAAKELPIPGSSGGVMSLDQFVKVAFQGSATERTFLEQHGFRVAAEREWEEHGVFVDTQLVQFTTPAGALAYVAAQRKAYESDPLLSEDYQISGVPSGYRWVYEALNTDGNTQDVMMAPSGTTVVSVYVYRPGTVDGSGDLALMRQQLQTLSTQS